MSESGPQPETPAETSKSLDQLLAEAQARIEEQRDAWLRALAEVENTRKRAQAEIALARRYAAERIAEDLLPVMDSLEAAAQSKDLSGLEMTLRQLKSAFEKAGIGEIAPGPGERFDPHRQQAMAAVESDAEPNTVVALLQKGYSLHERVVRPALVTVAKPVEKAAETPTSDNNVQSN